MQEKRTHIIQVILDKYESGNDWKNYKNSEVHGNRSIKIEQALYDEIGRTELNRQVLKLQKEGLLVDGRGKKSGWEQRGSELDRITYRLENIREFYARDGRTPKYELCDRELEEFKGAIETLKQSQPVWKDWLACCIEELEQCLAQEKIPDIYKKKKEVYFQTLVALNGLTEPVYERVFSKHYLGDSKRFQENIRDTMVRQAKKWMREIEDVADVMGEDEILAQMNIETYHQELAVKGGLKLQIQGKEVDLSGFAYGTVLNAQTLKYAEIPEKQEIRKIITIENKANFVSADYEEGTLFLFSHGFFTPKEREFLKRLREKLKNTPVEYYHTGDLDYGGIRIFSYIQKNIFPELKPLWMDRETFEIYRKEATPRKQDYLDKIVKMQVPESLEDLRRCILENKCTIEQESML